MRVSVIMPMRDAQAYVAEAIASVLQDQDFLAELVVIDDGSQDASKSIVEAIGDPRVRVINGPRRGIAACLNAGLAAATGDVIMRCDADDCYPDRRIASQVLWLEAHPNHAAVCGPFSTIDSEGRLIARLWHEHAAGCDDIAGELRRGIARTTLCTFAIRRSALERVGAFREYFEVGEDLDFAMRVGEVGPVGFVVTETYRYRLHDASITHTQPDARRTFFEQTAVEFARQRAESGTDALFRNVPPQPPDAGCGRPTKVAAQAYGMLVGEAWRALRLGHRWRAVRLASRALLLQPRMTAAWFEFAKVVWRCVAARADARSERGE